MCDRIWHVSFRSGEASWELLYSVYLYLYVLSVSFIYFFSPTLFYIDAVPSTGRCAALQYVLPPHGSVARTACSPAACALQWRRQDFVTGGVRYGPIGGLEYEVPQSRLYCPFINVALCSTALQCICRVIRRSSVTMKARTYYIIFGRPPIGGKLPPSPPGGATATDSGVARNCRQGVRESVAFLSVHSRSAALPSRPYNQKNVMTCHTA